MRIMKKMMVVFSLVVILCSAFFTGCSCNKDITYSVEKADFYYSIDNGSTYGNERYELETEQTVLMKIIICVTSTSEDPETIDCKLAIPKIDAVDAVCIETKAKMTPQIDDINNITYYNFKIVTNEDWTFRFEFQPNEPATVQMTLDFGSPVPEMYGVLKTIKFVDGQPTSE